jgi:hypothetical protein
MTQQQRADLGTPDGPFGPGVKVQSNFGSTRGRSAAIPALVPTPTPAPATPVAPPPTITRQPDGMHTMRHSPGVLSTDTTAPEFTRHRGNTMYGTDIGVGGQARTATPTPAPVPEPTPAAAAVKTPSKPDPIGHPRQSATLKRINSVPARIGGQLRATGQNLAMGGALAAGDKAIRGGADARSLGATLAGRENDPTDPQNIRKLYEALKDKAQVNDAVIDEPLPNMKVERVGAPPRPGEAQPTFNEKGEETITAGEHLRRLLGISKKKTER